QWTGPNGFSSTIPNPSINNLNANHSGWYKVSASGTNTCGGNDSVYINVHPIPEFSYTLSDSNICIGKTANLNIQQSGNNPIAITPNETVSGSDPNYQLRPTSKTTYTIAVGASTSCVVYKDFTID